MKKKQPKQELKIAREGDYSRLEHELLREVFNTRSEDLSEDKKNFFEISDIFPEHASDDDIFQVEKAIDLIMSISVYLFEDEENYQLINVVGSAEYNMEKKIIHLSIGNWIAPYMAFVSSEGLKKIEKKTIKI